MRVTILQHEPDEWIGSMQPWFEAKAYELTTVRVDLGEPVPDVDKFDWLILMGGAMSVYQESEYAWLVAEKQLIREAVAAGRKVLGICLGGQLIASALGAEVFPGDYQEIGWFDVTRTHPVAQWCPDQFTPLSWHGDRFDLPEGAVAFAKSDVTPYQGFCLSDKVWALQFHLETTNSVPDFYAVAGQQLPAGPFVQSYRQMVVDHYAAESRPVMHALLDVMNKA